MQNDLSSCNDFLELKIASYNEQKVGVQRAHEFHCLVAMTLWYTRIGKVFTNKKKYSKINRFHGTIYLTNNNKGKQEIITIIEFASSD